MADRLRCKMVINILGTEYKIIVKKYDEDEAFDKKKIEQMTDAD